MEISPEKWREASIHGIKLAQTIIERSDLTVEDGRLTDPLPLLRDACIKQSNDRIRTYTRTTRAVVVKLRRSFVEVNDEMKSANRCREILEKALEHKRKDLALNQASQEIRSCRPPREKQEPDYPEKLLQSEQSHLLSLKRSLEVHYRKVKLQLQELNAVRCCLAAAIQERSRVTDFLCHTMRNFSRPGSQTPRYGSPTPRDIARTSSSVSLQRSSPSASPREDVLESHVSTRSGASSRQKAYSAPVPLELGKDQNLHEMEGDVDAIDLGPAGPFGPLSVESLKCINLASEVILKSHDVRREAMSAMDHTQRLQQAAHESVNESLIKRIAQTVTLADHLEISSGETKLALQRSQRHYGAQQKALGYLLGPLSSSDLSSRERLDRPVVKIYQRHVGTDLPEAAHLIQATDQYKGSMDATIRSMELLKLANKGINADSKDKKKAAFIDSSVVRLRRRKANHRWVLKGRAYPLKPCCTEAALIRSSSH